MVNSSKLFDENFRCHVIELYPNLFLSLSPSHFLSLSISLSSSLFYMSSVHIYFTNTDLVDLCETEESWPGYDTAHEGWRTSSMLPDMLKLNLYTFADESDYGQY